MNLEEEYVFIRRVLGLTQAQFAKLIGVSTAVINKIEKGESEISKDILYKTYVEMQGILKISGELNLCEVEIFSIEKFCEQLNKRIDYFIKSSIQTKIEILRK